MAQNIEIRMRNVGDIVVGNTVAVVQENVRKVATCTTHNGREKGIYAVVWCINAAVATLSH